MYHRNQFSIAFDVYLDILRRVKIQTDTALGCDTLHWRVLNACPPCNYEVSTVKFYCVHVSVLIGLVTVRRQSAANTKGLTCG